MKYYQCSVCKGLKEVDESVHDTPQKITAEIKCHSRRMRELTKYQFDHETAQRAFIDGGMVKGTEPKDTALMNAIGRV